MIWLTWRQFRTQALAGAVAVAVVTAVYWATRSALLDLAKDVGYTGCTANCAQLADQFLDTAQKDVYGRLLFNGGVVLYVMPALIGLFWGAPLVARELETGTHRLVWNQTISRNRWLGVKLGGVGLASAVVAGLASWAITAWASPLDRAGGWMEPGTFTARGVVPIGYAVFAFVAGVTIGMLLRRTVTAMAVTLVVVGLAMFGSLALLRPHLAAQTTYLQTLTADRIGAIGMSINDPSRDIRVAAADPVSNAWILSNQVLDSAGKLYHGPYDPAKCGPDAPGGPKVCHEWLASQNLQQKVVYLAADKFWTIQWRELGVFLVASAALTTFCFWWIRRRVA